MRTLMIATAAAAIVAAAGTTQAQVGPRWAGTAPQSSLAPAPHAAPPSQASHPAPAAPASTQTWHQGVGAPDARHGGHSRWGARDRGRWWAGWRAPGGWGAYRRPYPGWTLPGYWNTPGFYIDDYAGYGLGAPPPGYSWSRYYDDAVLIDPAGRVREAIGGINWDSYPDAYDDAAPRGGPLDYDPYYHNYSADHAAPPYDFARRGPPPPPGPGYPPPPGATQGTIVNGWYYPPVTTTVVTIPGKPVTTTRTYTDYVTTYTSGSRPARRWTHTKLVPRKGKLVPRKAPAAPR